MGKIIELDAHRVHPYIMQAIEGFLRDPPDSDFQRGYLSALCMVMREGLVRGDSRVEAAERLAQKPTNEIVEPEGGPILTKMTADGPKAI